MSRYLITLPETFIHQIDYRVVYSDINAANHLGADRVLPIALEAQFSLVRSLGYEDAVVFENAGLIMVNSQVDYLSEVFYGDVLTVKVAASLPSEKSMELTYLITEKASDRHVAHVKTLLLFFHYKSQKVTTVPPNFKKKLLHKELEVN